MKYYCKIQNTNGGEVYGEISICGFIIGTESGKKADPVTNILNNNVILS